MIASSALRPTLRLIHCLQRERGASCALAGIRAANCINSSYNENVRLARAATNAAVKTFYQCDDVAHPTSSFNTASELFSLRELVDGVKMANPDETYGERKYELIHRVVKDFSSLISSAIKFYVVDIIDSSRIDHEYQIESESLQKLLLSFVELKESLGVERASLTGIMALGIKHSNSNYDEGDSNVFCEQAPESDAPSLPFIINDVVMVVENQHRILSELEKNSGVLITEQTHDYECDNHVAALDPNLLRLIGDSIKLSEDMQNLQDRIRKDFDMSRFQQGMTMEAFWSDITLYMDKLHSIELLLLEELDQCNEKQDHDFDLLSLEKKLKCNTQVQATDRLLDSSKPSSALENLDLKDWEINLYDVEFQRRIGRGAAGTTYLAKWTAQNVAVKCASISELGLDGWRTELASLKQLHHPNIVRFLGAIYNTTPPTYCLVLEYCDEDLSTRLAKATPAGFFLKVAHDIASGLLYLHQKNIIHRDIKPSNCLIQGIINSHYTAKLTDFGLAATIQNSTKGQELTAETGTYRYMSPQIIRHEPYDYSADVYSFALLMWELISREAPFEPLGQIEAATASAIEHNRPPFPSGIPLTLKAVIERCWVDRPEDRMTVPSIIEWLENATNHLTRESIAWLDHPNGHPVYKTQKGVHVLAKDPKKKTSLLRNALFGKKKRNDTFDRMG